MDNRNPEDLISEEGKDNELVIHLTSKTSHGKIRTIIKDDSVERHLTWMDEVFYGFKNNYGVYPNMIGLDEGWFKDMVQYKRVREKLKESIKEVNVIKRIGRTYVQVYHMTDKNKWYFPLRDGNYGYPLPYDSEPASFGANRKYDIHTGIDLYAKKGQKVYGVESGEVIHIEKFTGLDAGSPWWNDTKAVWVKGDSGIVVYGEIEPKVTVGQLITPDTVIGEVLEVLKVDKGKNPTSMLHLELYEEGMTETVVWKLGEEKPKFLKDPTPYIIRSLAPRVSNSLNFILEDE